jgi:hypothetical protein
MDLVLQVGGYLVGLVLQFLTINSMRHSAYREYPFLFLYVIADFLTALREIRPRLAYETGTPQAKKDWAAVYWIDEWVIQGLVFLLVISLVYRASAHLRPRRSLLAGLIGGTLLFAGISLWIHYSPEFKTGKWMTPWTRDMYFCAAILNLGLWAMLIASREKDRRLLMVSGALGIQFTAGAIGQALREISHDTVPVTAILIMVANLTCMFIWWQAFRHPAKSAERTVLPLPKTQKESAPSRRLSL